MQLARDVFGSWDGNELSILREFLPADLLTGQHQDCPICGAKKKFRFCPRYEGGRFICASCMPRTERWTDFLTMYFGCSFAELRQKLIPHLPEGPPKMQVVQTQINQAAERAIKETAKALRPILPGTVQYDYLNWRGIDPELFVHHPDVYAASLDYYYQVEGQTQKARVPDVPAIVLAMRDNTGRFATFERIYLDISGTRKFQAPQGEEAKKTMTPMRSYSGGGVWLRPPTEQTTKLVIGEGFENTAYLMSHEIPQRYCDGAAVVACMKAGNLERFDLPDRYNAIAIWGDNDVSGAGQKAAWTLYNRIVCRRRELRGRVFVRIPGHHYEHTGQNIDVCDWFYESPHTNNETRSGEAA